MARDEDDNRSIKRRWGDEAEPGAEKQTEGAKIEELIRRAQPMVEQINNLYSQFAAGVERLAPLDKRKQLEQILATLQALPKPNATYSFRVQTLQNHFATMRDRWDRMMKDIESGKIKRTLKRP